MELSVTRASLRLGLTIGRHRSRLHACAEQRPIFSCELP
jgi:hypothetical protein